MSIVSETVQEVSPVLSQDTGYQDIVLLLETPRCRLYSAVKSLRRLVLKTPAVQSGEAVELLKKEYEMSLKLSHPNLVYVFGYEPSGPVGPCIVMEYIDGISLDTFLANDPSLNERKRVFFQLLDVVDYIHSRGIVHNDLAPQNILICENCLVKLIDFGFADDDGHLLNKHLGGTRGYASPELLAGKDTNFRSDIWSIGVIMKQLFGRRYSKLVSLCMHQNPLHRPDSVKKVRTLFEHRHSRILGTTLLPLALIASVIFFLHRPFTKQAPGPENTNSPVGKMDTIATLPPEAEKNDTIMPAPVRLSGPKPTPASGPAMATVPVRQLTVSTSPENNVGPASQPDDTGPLKISWKAQFQTSTISGPAGADYTGFPYADASSVYDITRITDGKDGAVLVDNWQYLDDATFKFWQHGEKLYEFWSDAAGTKKHILAVGCNPNEQRGFYFLSSSFSGIRIKDGYVEIPAVPGYKLTHISLRFMKSKDEEIYSICSDKSGTKSKSLNGFFHRTIGPGSPVDEDVVDARANTTYYQYFGGHILLKSFEYTYSKSEDAPEYQIPAEDLTTNQPETPASVTEEEYVDLGLSVLWATCNLGASKPEDAGDYYAWGTTETRYSSISGNKVILKEGHKTNSYEDYEYCIITPGESGQPADTTWTKYNGTDGKKQLDPEDDAATQILGNGWRTPTHNEWEELRNHTRCEEKKDGDTVIGYYVYSTVSGYKDKYIFIPCPKLLLHDHLNLNIENSGLWSSTYRGLGTAQPGRSNAYREMPYNAFGDGSKGWTSGQLPYSRNIRPVKTK